MIEQLKRGSTKLLRRAIWTGQALRTKSPNVEVLYQDSTNGTVLCIHGPAYIEPESGYILTKDGFLLEDSLLTYPDYPDRPFKYHVPSPFHFWRNQHHPENTIAIPEVISLRFFWEWNYYHFYFDVLSKLELLHHAGFDTDLPLVLAKYVDTANFVRPLIGRGTFANCQWLNPNEKFVLADKIICCQTNRPYKDRISYLCHALNTKQTGTVEKDRIFLNRSSRCLSNFDELLPILSAYRFHIVDAANMSIDDQLDVFTNVRYLIAIHGAGTTNIIFRGERPLSVLELHSDRYMNFDHKRICNEMGYCWDHLEGKATEGIGIQGSAANFCVSKDALEQKIKQLLDE